MFLLNGLNNFLDFVNNNWTSIMVLIGLLLIIGKKISSYLGKSTEEKIEIAKGQINEAILKMITDAEMNYEEWSKAGSIKRSQVIKQIFSEWPILEKVMDQKTLIAWIDEMIDEALKTLREVIEENNE